MSQNPFQQVQTFLEAHRGCPWCAHHVWMTDEGATIVLMCDCGERLDVPCSRREGAAVVVGSRLMGVDMTVLGVSERVH